jgi:hypothetical protein
MQKIVNSRDNLREFFREVEEAFERYKYLVCSVTRKRRTLDQSAQAHVWYKQISKELGEDTPLGVKCECKLNVGIPMLCAEDDEFRQFWAMASKGLTYEEQLTAVKFVAVTSIMTIDVSNQYLRGLQDYWGPRGVSLKFLDCYEPGS